MSPDSRLRILFVARDLRRAGSQRQLVELLKALDKRRFAVGLALFYADPNGNDLLHELDDVDGVEVVCLEKESRWHLPSFVARLLAVGRRFRPDVVHSYLNVANLYATLLARYLGCPVIWGVRSSSHAYERMPPVHYIMYRVGIAMSGLADMVIFNSEAGRTYYREVGYRTRRMEVIPNGIDTDRFRPDPQGRARVRQLWGVGGDERVIGTVGRTVPQKDFPTFLAAAARLAKRRAGIRFVIVGDGDEYREQLAASTPARQLGDRLIWQDAVTDIEAYYNAMDIGTSTSLGEGFPNAVAEPMACGVPMVATKVGDTAHIVGDTGELIDVGDVAGLLAAWERLLERLDVDPVTTCSRPRQRMTECFSTELLAERTSALLVDMAPS